MEPAPDSPAPDSPAPGAATGAATGAGTALSTGTTGHGRRLVLAHGFTQTGAVWGGMDADLARDHQVVTADLPGHGGSAAIRASLPGAADLLAAAGGRADYLGYSMGARVCLHVALAHPDLVRSLVLVSGTAGLDDAGERAGRRAADEALAGRLDPPGDGAPVDTVAAFLDRWTAAPLFGRIPAGRAGRAERETNTAAGLASSLRLAGTGTQEPLWDRLPGLSLPVLVVTGARDTKYGDLARRLVAGVGGSASHVVVPDADHAPHLQHPETVASAVRAFLATVPAG